MSGHSKWATIRHKKGAADAKRAALFTKLSKAITVAAREGGDPEFNFSLRTAIDKALAGNMTKDRIDTAVKRGTGEIEGGIIEEVIYEGYGPGGAAVLIEALTDNRNRTSASLKHAFTKNGGSLGSSGSVQWMFERKGVVRASGKDELSDEDQLTLMDAGAEDIDREDGLHVFTSADSELAKLRGAVQQLGLTLEDAGLEWIAKDENEADDETKGALMKLFETLDEDEDVSNIYSNVTL
jgi:YebC/PmpR family DNA-binding regulatory protein